MSIKYTEIETPFGSKIIQRENEDGSISSIPMDEANADYQRYLNPEAEQSTPIVEVE
jgi:hypothetical protein